jgi:hypothetical protein
VKILRLRVRAIDVDVIVVRTIQGRPERLSELRWKRMTPEGYIPFLFGEYFSACIFLTLANCSDRTVSTVETTSSDAVADIGAASMS